MNYNNKRFKTLESTINGEVSDDTLFQYKQNGKIVSGTYSGGTILQGQLVGLVYPDNHLEFAYQHVNHKHEIMTGICKSYPELSANGKLILKEFWKWTCKDESKGESTLIEI